MLLARLPGAPGIVGVVLVASLLAGCQPVDPLQAAGLTVSVSDSWKSVDPLRWQTAGRALRAWSGPEGSSFVVHRGLPAPRTTAEQLAEGLVNRVTNLPGLKVLDRKEIKVAGVPAVRVDLVAPGFGDALAPSGAGTPVALEGKTLIPTHQTTVIVGRQAGPLSLRWNAAESAWPQIAPQVDAILGSLTLGPDTPLSSSSY